MKVDYLNKWIDTLLQRIQQANSRKGGSTKW
jgi:hypothetical protein